MLQNRRFSLWVSRSGFGTAICVAVVFFFGAFATKSADRSGMAVSGFLAAAAASAILLSCAAETRKWHCSGCIRVAHGALAVISLFCSWFSFSFFFIGLLQNRLSLQFGVEIRF